MALLSGTGSGHDLFTVRIDRELHIRPKVAVGELASLFYDTALSTPNPIGGFCGAFGLHAPLATVYELVPGDGCSIDRVFPVPNNPAFAGLEIDSQSTVLRGDKGEFSRPVRVRIF